MTTAATVEVEVHSCCQRGEYAAAAEAIVRGYGPELVRFLAGALRSSDDELAEVFATFCEDLVRGLPGFRFGSSVRTWVYTLARHAAARFRRGERRRGKRFTLPGELHEVADSVRSATAVHLRTTVKDRLAQAREQLDDDDRILLMLRVDRQLAWREVATVMADGELDDETLRRREQALRKRFETVKRRLRELLGEPP